MTDRVKGCWVAFEESIREDDAEPLISAIRMLRGVVSVKLNVEDDSDWMARSQIKMELIRRFQDILKSE